MTACKDWLTLEFEAIIIDILSEVSQQPLENVMYSTKIRESAKSVQNNNVLVGSRDFTILNLHNYVKQLVLSQNPNPNCQITGMWYPIPLLCPNVAIRCHFYARTQQSDPSQLCRNMTIRSISTLESQTKVYFQTIITSVINNATLIYMQVSQ